MTVVLQVSDPHFGTERRTAVEALLRFCAHLQPDLLLVTGDVTQRARRSQFDAARACFDALAVPTRLVIPGNHDIPLFNLFARVFHPYDGHIRTFGPALEGEFEREDLLVLTLNTTRRWRHKQGEVSPAQVGRVAERLSRARPGQVRLIAVHQPVAVTKGIDIQNLLRGHEAAVKRWAQAGADAVLGGHIHLPYVIPLHQVWPELARPMWAVQAGTALSHRLRGGTSNSVNVVRTAQDRRAVVERWDLDDGAGAFLLAATTSIAST